MASIATGARFGKTGHSGKQSPGDAVHGRVFKRRTSAAGTAGGSPLNPRSACRPRKSPWVRALAVSLLAAVSPLAPGSPSLRAQVSPEILQVLQQGGAWVALPIEDGVGSFESQPVPTLGIQLQGHLRIWEEHTGSWHVVMRDLARAEDPVILERLMVPGERVEFDYQTGMLGQIQIEVQWSEARDTTLRVWVGTELTPGDSNALTSTDVYWNYAGSEGRVLSAGSQGLREQAQDFVHQRGADQRRAPARIERRGDLHHIGPHEVEPPQAVQERDRLAGG